MQPDPVASSFGRMVEVASDPDKAAESLTPEERRDYAERQRSVVEARDQAAASNSECCPDGDCPWEAMGHPEVCSGRRDGVDEREWVAWGFANLTLPEAIRRLAATNADRKARGEEPLGEPPFTGTRSAARPRLLDLFCGAGGAAMGYRRAGFDVIGVDIKPQPRYPFEFIRADVMNVTVEDGWWIIPRITAYGRETSRQRNFAAVHASPPCQRYSDLAYRNGNADEHPDLIWPIRELLKATGLPYVIENVEGAPLHDPWLICGTERGLRLDGYRLRRHRLFETNWPLVATGCGCTPEASEGVPVLDVSGGGPSHAPRLDGKGGRTYKGTADQVRAIMGMPWATKAECNEAVPPAYTEFIGRQLLAHVRQEVAA